MYAVVDECAAAAYTRKRHLWDGEHCTFERAGLPSSAIGQFIPLSGRWARPQPLPRYNAHILFCCYPTWWEPYVYETAVVQTCSATSHHMFDREWQMLSVNCADVQTIKCQDADIAVRVGGPDHWSLLYLIFSTCEMRCRGDTCYELICNVESVVYHVSFRFLGFLPTRFLRANQCFHADVSHRRCDNLPRLHIRLGTIF